MNESHNTSTKCGYVAVVGLPNVGKSTLINRILGQKLSIVTDKPQTTRNRILAIHDEEDAQIVFLDTPGIHLPKGKLGEYMNDQAHSAISEADVCVFLIDASRKKKSADLDGGERAIVQALSRGDTPVIAAINKIDLVPDKSHLLPLMSSLSNVEILSEIIPVSALKNDGVELLTQRLVSRLPQTPKLYPPDMISEQGDRFFVAELIREAAMEVTHQEVPYQTAVVIDQFVEETERCRIKATIHVARDSQRVIMLGKSGSRLKDIGTRARRAISEFLKRPVELGLHINVSKEWFGNSRGLKKMGYE